MSRRRYIAGAAIIATLLIATLSYAYTKTAYAHRSGCHRWHSCPSDSGSYVCGDTGYDNYCGTTPVPVYKAPVVHTKDFVEELTVPFITVEEPNPNEYEGYRQLVTSGAEGRKSSKTSVTYTDGKESYRGDAEESVLQEPKNAVYSVGSRKRPSAYIDYVSEGDTGHFLWFKVKKYDVLASGAPGENLALLRNGRVVQLSTVRKDGSLTFSSIKLRDNDRLEVGSYSGKKVLWFMPSAKSLSEKTYVNLEKKALLTEYDKLHGKQATTPRDKDIDQNPCADDVAQAYLKSRTAFEETQDKSSGVVLIYYPEPCSIRIE